MQPGTYCTNCGSELRARSRFCTNCGVEREKPPASSTRSTSSSDPGTTIVLGSAELGQVEAEPRQAPISQSAQPPTPPRPSIDPAATVALRPEVVAERVSFESPSPPGQAEPAAPVQARTGMAKRKWYRPGLIAWLAFIVIIAIIYGVTLLILGSDRPLTFWDVVRGSGFATYELLTISVLLGIFLTWRVRPFTGIWLVAEKLHPLVLLTAGVAASIHLVGMLKLDFPVQQALVPFTSDFRTGPLSLGIFSLYVGSLLVLSTYLMSFTGFKVWRIAHYASLVAWGTALAHGFGTGHDTQQAWALALYIVGAVLVAVFLVIMLVRMVNGAADRATQQGAGAA